MKEMNMIKEGQLLYFTEGSYSDFGVVATGIALKDFDFETIKLSWARENGKMVTENWERRKQVSFDIAKFLIYLFNFSGLVKEVPATECHLSEYGRVYLE